MAIIPDFVKNPQNGLNFQSGSGSSTSLDLIEQVLTFFDKSIVMYRRSQKFHTNSPSLGKGARGDSSDKWWSKWEQKVKNRQQVSQNSQKVVKMAIILSRVCQKSAIWLKFLKKPPLRHNLLALI